MPHPRDLRSAGEEGLGFGHSGKGGGAGSHVWVAIRAAGGCPKAVRSMPSQEYVFDPQLKRVVSQDKVDKQKDWLTATTEGLSRAGADALDAAGQSINLAPAAHRRHESTPEVHADDEVEEDDYAPLFPATTQALDDAAGALGDRAARTRRWLFPPKKLDEPPPPPQLKHAQPAWWPPSSPRGLHAAEAPPADSWWWERRGLA